MYIYIKVHSFWDQSMIFLSKLTIFVNNGYFNPPFELSKIIKSYFNVVE